MKYLDFIKNPHYNEKIDVDYIKYIPIKNIKLIIKYNCKLINKTKEVCALLDLIGLQEL